MMPAIITPCARCNEVNEQFSDSVYSLIIKGNGSAYFEIENLVGATLTEASSILEVSPDEYGGIQEGCRNCPNDLQIYNIPFMRKLYSNLDRNRSYLGHMNMGEKKDIVTQGILKSFLGCVFSDMKKIRTENLQSAFMDYEEGIEV